MNLNQQLRKISVEFHLLPSLRWHCAFFESDLTTRVGRMRHFASDDHLIDMLKRGNGLKDLADRQAFEHAMQNGHGRAIMHLDPEQYAKLRG